MPFTPADGVPCQLLPDGRLRVTAPIVWTGSRDAVLIPAGTVTDLASVPRVARGLVDVGGPIGRAAIVHDVLCDAANEWTAQGCPEESRPRFLGPDIDGALRAAARDLGAAQGERWLYWVAVRWAALFGSTGRRQDWARTLWPVLALTLPALLVALPAVLGALTARALLALVDVCAWPFTRTRPVLPGRRPAPASVAYEATRARQLPPGAAQLAHAAAQLAHAAAEPASPESSGPVTVWSGPAPIGPTSGSQAVIRARRAAARQRTREPAPWCATYLQPCEAWCSPSRGCQRRLTRAEETR